MKSDDTHRNIVQEAQAFYAGNRKKLATKAELIVIAGHSNLQAKGKRTLPFQQDSNFFYLTGLEEPGFTLVINGEKEFLIVPEKSDTQIAFEGDLDRKGINETSGITDIFGRTEGWQKLEALVKSVKTVGLLKPSEEFIEHYEMHTNPARRILQERLIRHINSAELTDLREVMAEMRIIKQAYEIKMIENAIDLTAQAYKKIDVCRQTAKNEKEIMAELMSFAVMNNAKIAFEPIIASGLNATTLHYQKNNSQINPNSLLLLDIGLSYRGYNSDLTRTIAKHTPTERQKQVYAAVLDVHGYAISLLKPGIQMQEYEEKVKNKIIEKLETLKLNKDEIKKYYPHATSHFLGLDVHDVGDYSKPLQPGTLLTVEPGIYIKEESIGVRIEDNVLITEKAVKVLTNMLPRNIVSLTIKP